jgi:hypothetical protein
LRLPFGRQQRTPIKRRKKILRPALDDPQAVVVQPQISNDLGIEKTDGVGSN